jgi:membrane protease YdiL (CAAX protease family)
MSEKRNLRQTITGFSGAFSTGIALQLWLFFLFCFYFLGYPVALSILLGMAAGLGGGWVFGWWKTKDDPKDLQPVESQKVEEPTPRKVSGLRLAKQRRDAAKAKRGSQGSPISFFRR